ncbi:transposase family protein, partial [Streptomyces sp. NY05-11A]|nr:transposase family protein [Streptomyces sp. NY05-11A]
MFVDRLLATLVHLRHEVTHDVSACWFGVDRSTITRAVNEVRPLLAERGCTVSPDVRLRSLAEVVDHLGACGKTRSPPNIPTSARCGSTAAAASTLSSTRRPSASTWTSLNAGPGPGDSAQSRNDGWARSVKHSALMESVALPFRWSRSRFGGCTSPADG